MQVCNQLAHTGLPVNVVHCVHARAGKAASERGTFPHSIDDPIGDKSLLSCQCIRCFIQAMTHSIDEFAVVKAILEMLPFTQRLWQHSLAGGPRPLWPANLTYPLQAGMLR